MGTFLKYTSLGSVGAITDTLVFWWLVSVQTHVIFANTLSTTIGILISYLLNAKFTFKRKVYRIKESVTFFVVGGFGILLSTVSISVLIQIINLDAIFAKCISLPMVAIFQYQMNKTFTFKPKS